MAGKTAQARIQRVEAQNVLDMHAADLAQAKMQAEAAARRHEDAQHRADIAAAEFGHVAKRGREFVNKDSASWVSKAHKSLFTNSLPLLATSNSAAAMSALCWASSCLLTAASACILAWATSAACTSITLWASALWIPA